MPPHGSPSGHSGLINNLLEVEPAAAPDEIIERLPDVTPELCRRTLEGLPLDQTSFQAQYAAARQRTIEHIAALYARIAGRGERRVGMIGLVLLTLRLVAYFDSQRSVDAQPRAGRLAQPALQAARELLNHRPIRQALHAVYSPALDGHPAVLEMGRERVDERNAERIAVWQALDVESMALHELGTTSFILRAEARQVIPTARRSMVAVKCVLLPYTRIPAIAMATANYAAVFEQAPRRSSREIVDHFPVVYASAQAWVVMEFVAGPTLAQILHDAHADRSPRGRGSGNQTGSWLRLDLLTTYGPLLFDALASVQQSGLVHLDLAPSNIIIEGTPSTATMRAVIIDFGRNHLYTRSIGAMEGPESTYVAPEVKEELPEDIQSPDLFSLGKLLIALGGMYPANTQTVPDQFYISTPTLARFVEDLIDLRPARRLVFYGGERWTYTSLARDFRLELDALREAEREGFAATRPGSGARALLDLFRPSSRSPSRQLRLWRARLQQLNRAYSVDPDGSSMLGTARTNVRLARMLLLWSALCSACWGIFLTVIGIQVLRDLGVDPTPFVFDLLRRVADLVGRSAELSGVEAWLRQHLGDPGAVNAGARLVGTSFALVNVRLYQNLYAGVTPLVGWRSLPRWRRLHALAAEGLIRLFAFWWLLLVLGPQFGRPLTWPLWVTTGLAVAFLLNWTVTSFANRAVADAQDSELSTVPPRGQQITGLTLFSRWSPSMLAYLVIVAPTSWLIYRGVLQDELMYALMVAMANVGVFYFVKCTMDAPEIRNGLARAFFASARVAVIRRREQAGRL